MKEQIKAQTTLRNAAAIQREECAKALQKRNRIKREEFTLCIRVNQRAEVTFLNEEQRKRYISRLKETAVKEGGAKALQALTIDEYLKRTPCH